MNDNILFAVVGAVIGGSLGFILTPETDTTDLKLQVMESRMDARFQSLERSDDQVLELVRALSEKESGDSFIGNGDIRLHSSDEASDCCTDAVYWEEVPLLK